MIIWIIKGTFRKIGELSGMFSKKHELKKYGLIILGTAFIAFAVCKSGDGLV